MKCVHLDNGKCQVASKLASLPVSVTAETCGVCSMEYQPQTTNRVTCGIAVLALRNAGLQVDADLISCAASSANGVGSQLELLIEAVRSIRFIGAIWPAPANCRCSALRTKLNALGPVQCRKRAWRLGFAVASSAGAVLSYPFVAVVAMFLVWLAAYNYEKSEA